MNRLAYHAPPCGSGRHPAARSVASSFSTAAVTAMMAAGSLGGQSSGSERAMVTSPVPPAGRATAAKRGPSSMSRHSIAAVQTRWKSGGDASTTGPKRPPSTAEPGRRSSAWTAPLVIAAISKEI